MLERPTRTEMLSPGLLPHGSMLTVCPAAGCMTLTMGGTCVAHDQPITVEFQRGRPFAPAVADRVPARA